MSDNRKLLAESQISCFADEIDTSVDKQISVLKDLGISWIEFRSGDGIGAADYTLQQAEELKKRLDAAGIRVSALGSPIGKIGINDDFAPHLEKLRHAAEVAGVLGTRYIRMFSFYIPEGHSPEEYRAEVMARMSEMVRLASEMDVVLLHENEKGIYGDNAERCLELMKNFSGSNFGCTFDFANFVQCSQDTEEAYEMLKSYITYVHVKDAEWESKEVVPPGSGSGNLKDIFKKLDKSGYKGFLSLEPHLANFSGLASLEQHAEERAENDTEKAFRIAYRSLKQILD